MNRETMKRRIAALRDKTTARGCTEAEAMAAAAKAAHLMQEYSLSENDLEIDQVSVKSKTAGTAARDQLWAVLARCTNTASVFVSTRVSYTRSFETQIVFVGRDPGPEVAGYLFVVLNRAVDQAIASFKKEVFYRRRRNVSTKRQAVEDFTIALITRLAKRLLDLFSSTLDRSAIVAATAALDKLYPSAATVPQKEREQRYSEAAFAGHVAANAVNLAHGVSGKSPAPMLIGGDK